MAIRARASFRSCFTGRFCAQQAIHSCGSRRVTCRRAQSSSSAGSRMPVSFRRQPPTRMRCDATFRKSFALQLTKNGRRDGVSANPVRPRSSFTSSTLQLKPRIITTTALRNRNRIFQSRAYGKEEIRPARIRRSPGRRRCVFPFALSCVVASHCSHAEESRRARWSWQEAPELHFMACARPNDYRAYRMADLYDQRVGFTQAGSRAFEGMQRAMANGEWPSQSKRRGRLSRTGL